MQSNIVSQAIGHKLQNNNNTCNPAPRLSQLYLHVVTQCTHFISPKLITQSQGVPVLEISDPNPIFQIAPLPTHPLRHIAYYNDIHNQNLNIHTVNYIHMWFYLCMNIINILMILNLYCVCCCLMIIITFCNKL